MRTHTKFFNFSKVAIADGASAVVRVAMVCNDLAIANSSLGHYKNLSSNALSHIRQGGMLYFVRMSCGHLREGMKTIQAIKDNAALSALVTRCSPTHNRHLSSCANACPLEDIVPSFNAMCHRFGIRQPSTTIQPK